MKKTKNKLTFLIAIDLENFISQLIDFWLIGKVIILGSNFWVSGGSAFWSCGKTPQSVMGKYNQSQAYFATTV